MREYFKRQGYEMPKDLVQANEIQAQFLIPWTVSLMSGLELTSHIGYQRLKFTEAFQFISYRTPGLPHSTKLILGDILMEIVNTLVAYYNLEMVRGNKTKS